MILLIEKLLRRWINANLDLPGVSACFNRCYKQVKRFVRRRDRWSKATLIANAYGYRTSYQLMLQRVVHFALPDDPYFLATIPLSEW